MNTVANLQENAEDIYEEAKQINDENAADDIIYDDFFEESEDIANGDEA
jgi:exonuclease I